MKKIILLPLLFIALHSISQSSIDLKTLIGKTKEEAMKSFTLWKIKLEPSVEYSSLLSGYNDGIQVKLRNDTVTTIWVEFTSRRTGAFPFQADSIVKPNTNIQDVIRTYGDPQETGGGGKIGDTHLGGWMKWKTKAYQLHCEVIDSIVVMTTIMEADWEPGQ